MTSPLLSARDPEPMAEPEGSFFDHEERIATVEDLYALHLPRHPLMEGVWGPRERRSLEVTRHVSLPGTTSPGSGCICVFSPHRMPRTLMVREGAFVAIE